MKKISNNKLTATVLNEMFKKTTEKMFVDLIVDKQMKTQTRRDEYIAENKDEWKRKGELLKVRREKHEISLKRVAEILGTSATRISRLEKGEPVSMSVSLTKTYNLLFDYIELRKFFTDLYNEYDINWRL